MNYALLSPECALYRTFLKLCLIRSQRNLCRGKNFIAGSQEYMLMQTNFIFYSLTPLKHIPITYLIDNILTNTKQLTQ